MSKPKLLVVEDDPALCAQYKWGFPAWRVLIANDRAEAEAAARRVPIYDYRLKKEIPAFNVRGMGIDKLLVPPNIKLPDDIGLRECSGQSGPAGERVFATHCR